MSQISEELGVDVTVACGASRNSPAAQRVCTGEAVWIVRPECSHNSGHHKKTSWTPICDPCRTLTRHNSWMCLQCGARAYLKADLL